MQNIRAHDLSQASHSLKTCLEEAVVISRRPGYSRTGSSEPTASRGISGAAIHWSGGM